MSLLVNRNRFGIGLIDTTKSAFYGWGVKGATQAHLPPRTRSGHFNPRARKGRDSRVHRGRGLPLVSIHAPVKGATSAAMRLGFFRCVSIHAPVKGATRRGGRLQDVRQVSIHAPTRGATPDSCHKHVTFEFQSTRPQGARPGSPSSSYRVKSFQSTRPQGARPVMTTAHTMQGLFQSTRPQGARRRRAGDAGHRRQVSIHAPARGATGVARLRHKWIVVSIHAPARGATLPRYPAQLSTKFQSTRPQGARQV